MISISILYHHPVQTLSFLALMMALCSLWVKKTGWLWGSFGLISLIGAFASGLLAPIALLPLGFFLLLLFGLRLNVQGFSRFLLASTAFLVGAALFFHLMPGFLEQTSLPYPLCLNYGKTFVGLILLGWIVPTFTFSRDSLKTVNISFGVALIGTALLSLIFFLPMQSALNFHFSFSFFPWALVTLLCVIIPEEALLRGFLQKELTVWIGGGMKAQVSATLITTCLYPLFHLGWVSDLTLLAPICAAGFTYALLYQMTKNVETPIISHFLINCLYFLFFGQGLPCLRFGL